MQREKGEGGRREGRRKKGYGKEGMERESTLEVSNLQVQSRLLNINHINKGVLRLNKGLKSDVVREIDMYIVH